MRSIRTLAAAAAVLAATACADAPTAAPAEVAEAPRAAAVPALGQISYSVTEYSNPTRWVVYFSTATSSTISSRTWKHYGGTGINPWGNGAYKYQVERTTPGCVAVELKTTFTDGSVTYDTEGVNVGGATGPCSIPW